MNQESAFESLCEWARTVKSPDFLDVAASGPLGRHVLRAGPYIALFDAWQELCAGSLPALPDGLRRKDSVYLVITTKCNNGWAYQTDREKSLAYKTCGHCLNGSGPHGMSMTFSEVEQVVGNLPEGLREVEISGGEVLHPSVFPLTRFTLECCADRYGPNLLLSLQTNGDFLRHPRHAHEILAQLRESGLRRLVVASMDIYHGRGATLQEKFDERKRHYAKIKQDLQMEPVQFVNQADYGLLSENPVS